MEKIEDFLNVEQASKKMGFNCDTIRRWCRNGELKHYKVGRQIRIKESDAVEFIKDGEVLSDEQ